VKKLRHTQWLTVSLLEQDVPGVKLLTYGTFCYARPSAGNENEQ